MRQKTLTKQCNACGFCIMTDNNQLSCAWGNSKALKILVPTKRKKGQPNCRLLKK
jgi:hypothetical protein